MAQRIDKADPAIIERIRIMREVRGEDDVDIAQMLGMKASEMVAVARRHGIQRRPGPALSDEKKLRNELEYRLPDDPQQRAKTLTAIVAWLARRNRQAKSSSGKIR